MANTTTTATGTVPQLIFSGGPALTTSYVTQVQFDTHGAEYIGFQMSYVKGGETSLQTSFEVLFNGRTDWIVVPVIDGAAQPSDAASVSRAFQVFLGKDAQQIRIRAKTTGAANGTTAVNIWALLSAPTFPITGNV